MIKRPDPQYNIMHGRVRRARGPASAHLCVHCIEHGIEKPARDWAQIHTEEGTDPWADYWPVCKSSHAKYDGIGRGKKTEQHKARIGAGNRGKRRTEEAKAKVRKVAVHRSRNDEGRFI